MCLFLRKITAWLFVGVTVGCVGQLSAMEQDVVGAVAHKNMCPICLGTERASDKTLTCGTQIFDGCSDLHVFHGRCIAKYLRERGAQATCPLCRAPLYDEMDNSEEVENAAGVAGVLAPVDAAHAGAGEHSDHDEFVAALVPQPEAPIPAPVQHALPAQYVVVQALPRSFLSQIHYPMYAPVSVAQSSMPSRYEMFRRGNSSYQMSASVAVVQPPLIENPFHLMPDQEPDNRNVSLAFSRYRR